MRHRCSQCRQLENRRNGQQTKTDEFRCQKKKNLPQGGAFFCPGQKVQGNTPITAYDALNAPAARAWALTVDGVGVVYQPAMRRPCLVALLFRQIHGGLVDIRYLVDRRFFRCPDRYRQDWRDLRQLIAWHVNTGPDHGKRGQQRGVRVAMTRIGSGKRPVGVPRVAGIGSRCPRIGLHRQAGLISSDWQLRQARARGSRARRGRICRR